jgi:DNA-directed RNA polymerase specialized sigma24 family protein
MGKTKAREIRPYSDLLPLVACESRTPDAYYRTSFSRLRKIAATLLRRERANHTLQATALVNEMFLKLHSFETKMLGEDHFLRLATRTMKQVLVDYARLKAPRHTIPVAFLPEFLAVPEGPEAPETKLAVRMVFESLKQVDAKAADTIWLRCVEGYTIDQVSTLQKREAWRVRADYDYGLRWMSTQLARNS